VTFLCTKKRYIREKEIRASFEFERREEKELEIQQSIACAQSIARRRQGVRPRRGGPMRAESLKREEKKMLQAKNRDACLFLGHGGYIFSSSGDHVHRAEDDLP